MDDYASKGFMQTTHRRWVDLNNPTVDMIHYDDIEAAANTIRRFNGHSNVTLAEHSCRVHDIVATHFGFADHLRLAALFHDAHEVYVADLPSPMKAALRANTPGGYSTYDEMEDRMAAVVATKFGFNIEDTKDPIIKQADTFALAIEANNTWGPGTAESWGLTLPSVDRRFWSNDSNMRSRIPLAPSVSAEQPIILEGTDLQQQQFTTAYSRGEHPSNAKASP